MGCPHLANNTPLGVREGTQGVAELANALVLGTRNCGFKSRRPDPCGGVIREFCRDPAAKLLV